MIVPLTDTINKRTNVYINEVVPVHALKAYGVVVQFRLLLYQHWMDVNCQLQGPTS
jgi:hypothetical protein